MQIKDEKQQLRERIILIGDNIKYISNRLNELNKQYRRKCDYPIIYMFSYSNADALAYEINSVREIKNNLIDYEYKLNNELLKL